MSKTIFPMDIDRKDIVAVSGYSRAILDLLDWIKKETDYDPAKRYVDSVKILDGIGEVNKEITKALNAIREDLPTSLFTQPQNS